MIHAHLGEGILAAHPGLAPDCFSFLGSRLTDWTIKGLKEIGYFTGPAGDPSFLINHYIFPEEGGTAQVSDPLDHRRAETRREASLRGSSGEEEEARGRGAPGGTKPAWHQLEMRGWTCPLVATFGQGRLSRKGRGMGSREGRTRDGWRRGCATERQEGATSPRAKARGN